MRAVHDDELPAGPAKTAALGVIARRAQLPAWQQINRLEQVLAQAPQVECPLQHVFTPGLYARQITMPAGSLITSRIHLTEHPFVIASGHVSVWSDDDGWVSLAAPHLGVTKPGTRRVLMVHEDTVFITFHVTDKTDPDALVDELTFDPMELGHLDDLPAEQQAAVRNFCRERKTLR